MLEFDFFNIFSGLKSTLNILKRFQNRKMKVFISSPTEKTENEWWKRRETRACNKYFMIRNYLAFIMAQNIKNERKKSTQKHDANNFQRLCLFLPSSKNNSMFSSATMRYNSHKNPWRISKHAQSWIKMNLATLEKQQKKRLKYFPVEKTSESSWNCNFL